MDKIDFQFPSDVKNFLVCRNDQLERPRMPEVCAAGMINKFRRIFSNAVDLGPGSDKTRRYYDIKEDLAIRSNQAYIF
jgi:hypothetical protein